MRALYLDVFALSEACDAGVSLGEWAEADNDFRLHDAIAGHGGARTHAVDPRVHTPRKEVAVVVHPRYDIVQLIRCEPARRHKRDGDWRDGRDTGRALTHPMT